MASNTTAFAYTSIGYQFAHDANSTDNATRAEKPISMNAIASTRVNNQCSALGNTTCFIAERGALNSPSWFFPRTVAWNDST